MSGVNMNTLVKKVAWLGPLVAIVIAAVFYIRSYNGSEKVERPTTKSGVSQSSTTLTITKEEAPRMIEIPAFQRLVYGVVENDVAYIVHVRLRDEPDPTRIVQFQIPSRQDRPSNWSSPLEGGNYTRIGFTVDPTSAKDIGHIDYVFEPH